MQQTEIKRALISVVILAISYGVYASWIAPWVEPAAVRRVTATELPKHDGVRAVDRYLDDLQQIFPADSWEVKSPKVLRHRDTLLLFREYHPQDDGTIRVQPCTVVLLDSRQDATSTLVMQAPEGAILQLDRAVDLKGAQLGRPVAGRLLGQIVIRRLGQPNGVGRLHAVTSNVQINPQRIWTPQKVDLEYENSRARGEDLMIKLMQKSNTSDSERAPGWAGIRSIELVRLDHLHLEIAQSDIKDEQGQRVVTPIDVTCRGPLRVDFIDNQLTCEDRVELVRTNPDGKLDNLKCDRLAFSFHPADPKPFAQGVETPPTATVATGREKPAKPPKLELHRVLAEGNPVILDAESQQAHIRSRRLLYDLQLGRFRLWADPRDARDQVMFRIDQHEIVSRELDCYIEPGLGLRRALAKGPGEYHGLLPGDEPQSLSARWQERLSYDPDGAAFRLTIADDATVALGEDSRIHAHMIHLWVEPDREAQRSGPVASKLGDKFGRIALRPLRVVAVAHPDRLETDPVTLRTDDVLGITERLEARFEHVAAPTQTLPVTRNASYPLNESLTTSTVSSSTPRPLRSPLPSGKATRGNATGSESRVFGRSLNAVLQMSPRGDNRQQGQFFVRSMLLEKDVHIEQVSRQDPSTPQVVLTGSSVRVEDAGDQTNHVIVASGDPVRIVSDKMQLVTHELQVDEERNLIWTERPGRMNVLIDRDAEGKPLAEPQKMTIDWHERMEFNGQVASFFGRVEAVGPDQRLRSDKVSIKLAQPIGVNNRPNGPQSKTDIEVIQAEGNVSIETRERDDAGQLTGLSFLNVPDAQINAKTGELIAGGPGRVIALRQGFNGELSFGATESSAPVETPDSQLTFIQVDYQHQIRGNMRRHVVEFSNRVQVIYGPVESWNETIRQDAPLRKSDALLSCDSLILAEGAPLPQTGDRTIDLLAQGNTVVEAKLFTAYGDRLSYEQAKDQLVLEGTGTTDATLVHHARVGARQSKQVARKFMYWPKSRRLEINEGLITDLNDLQGFGR